jgi:hypothetical protein
MTEEYKGVFDIPPPGGGLNESERLLVRLCCRPSIDLTTRDNQDDKFLMG